MASAQTAEQTVNVRMISTTTPEERVANEMKEKELRKAAEEKKAAEEAARIEATSPKALLSNAHILHISSNTTYFEEVQLENALRKRNEIDQWQIAMLDGWGKRDVADTCVEIDRPFFTFTYTYNTNRNTGIILATGKSTRSTAMRRRLCSLTESLGRLGCRGETRRSDGQDPGAVRSALI
jgi:hypothetical protein